MWWSEGRISSRAARLALPLLLAACGFTPLYDPGTAATQMLGRVEVTPLPGPAGFALHERLMNRLGLPADPVYRLDVSLDLVSSGTALTSDNDTTRFEVLGTALYALVPLDGGEAVLGDEVEAVASYSAPVSDAVSAFGSLAAERNAELRVARILADRIATQVALNAGRLAPGTVPAQ